MCSRRNPVPHKFCPFYPIPPMSEVEDAALCVILSGGRMPAVELQAERRSGRHVSDGRDLGWGSR